MINELGLPDEPFAGLIAHEPVTAQINYETGSNSSLLDEPIPDTVLAPFPPPPEPETEEDPYVDDWADSEIYKYAFELHYDRMVKRKLISVELIKKPVVPKE